MPVYAYKGFDRAGKNITGTLDADSPRTIKTSLRKDGISGEVVIADNGSEDGSQEIAKRLGARVVPVSGRGYGAALHGGFEAARGRFVIMGDADDSYDFSSLMPFV